MYAEKLLFAGILQAWETSSKLSYCLHTAEDAGSIPASPTQKKRCFAGKTQVQGGGSGLTPGLFYTSPVTVVPTSADAAPAPGPVAGWGPRATESSGSCV